MKKSILNLGKVLNKIQQKNITGSGGRSVGISDGDCDQNQQSQIHCLNNPNVCDLDAKCNEQTGKCDCDTSAGYNPGWPF